LYRWTYTWDAENRLNQMQTNYSTLPPNAPGYRLTFTYDGLSRRTSKKVEKQTASGGAWAVSNWEGYVYEGWNMILAVRFNADGTLRGRVATYVWGPDLASAAYGYGNPAWQKAGGVGGLLMVVDGAKTSLTYPPTAGATDDRDDDDFFPVSDRLGNIFMAVRAHSPRQTGTLPNTGAATYTSSDTSLQEYDAFGRVVRSTGLAWDVMPFQFSSKYTDAETGNNYYGYRFYDPNNGRWLNRDPIGERGGLNLYGMVGNDPVNKWDYLGMDIMDWVSHVFDWFVETSSTATKNNGGAATGAVWTGYKYANAACAVGLTAECIAARAEADACFGEGIHEDPAGFNPDRCVELKKLASEICDVAAAGANAAR
jgi:RHS repeat-associated protein